MKWVVNNILWNYLSLVSIRVNMIEEFVGCSIWILMQRWKHTFYDETAKKNRFSRHSIERKDRVWSMVTPFFVVFTSILLAITNYRDLSWFIANFFIRKATKPDLKNDSCYSIGYSILHELVTIYIAQNFIQVHISSCT